MPAADPIELGEQANADLLRLLELLRRDTIATLLAAAEPWQLTYRQLLREIDGLIATFERQAITALNGHIDRSANAGDEAALDDMRSAGIQFPASYVGVSETLVRTAAEYSADLVRDITADTRRRITQAVRRGALGQTPVIELIDTIGRSLDSPSIFGTVASRAEAIARTEVSRVYSMAKSDQGAELAGRYPGMRKRWVHAGHGRQSRANHVRLAAATEAAPIPFEEPFDLGSVTARYPHDPLLPASESVHCRCRMVLVAPDPEGAMPL